MARSTPHLATWYGSALGALSADEMPGLCEEGLQGFAGNLYQAHQDDRLTEIVLGHIVYTRVGGDEVLARLLPPAN